MRRLRLLSLPVAFLFAVAAVSSTSCTRSVRIPPENYDALNRSEAGGYRLRTMDGKIYEVRSLSVQDSVVVVDDPQSEFDTRRYPVTIAAADVESIAIVESTIGGRLLVSWVVIMWALVAVLVVSLHKYENSSD